MIAKSVLCGLNWLSLQLSAAVNNFFLLFFVNRKLIRKRIVENTNVIWVAENVIPINTMHRILILWISVFHNNLTASFNMDVLVLIYYVYRTKNILVLPVYLRNSTKWYICIFKHIKGWSLKEQKTGRRKQ